MTTFDDREHAYEAHFAFEEQLEFKAQARRDRLIGVWAAERLDLSGDDIETYILSIMRADLREPGDGDVHQKVMADLADKGLHVHAQEVRERMDAFLVQARQEVQTTG